MSDPRPAVLQYVEKICPGAGLSPVAGDASGRRFYRLRLPSGVTRIVMDHGRSFDGETDDVKLSRVFRAAGLPVAEIHDVAGEAGCLLLEDLGDLTLESALGDGGYAPRELVERAVLLAADVAVRGTPALAGSERRGGPALDAARFRFEMQFYLEHYAGSHLGLETSPALAEQLQGLADRAAVSPRKVLCHRDYHSRNLMVGRDGQLSMVDIQDARWGPDTYDLASLLRDCYVDYPEEWIDPMIERFLNALPDPPPAAEFRRRFRIVEAQRMLKALGTFGYQIAVVGRTSYRSAIPRTVARLRRLLPELEETKALHAQLTQANLL